MSRRWLVPGLAQLIAAMALLWLLPGVRAVHAQHAEVPRQSLEQAAPRLRQKGYVLMMRHGQTEPGVGDPENFKLGDCSTQRNLAESGREQSRRVGQGLAQAGVVIDAVRTSQWCRCIETARLAFGRADEWPVLNSTFRDRDLQAERGRQIIEYARGLAPGQNVMLVTHQLTITPLVGGWVDSAEIVAFKVEGARLVPKFRITPPAMPAP